MNRELLKELGLEKEAIDKIMTENGKDIEGYKLQLSTLEAAKQGLEQQLSEANNQIESFKELDIDGIKAAAEDYKQKFEAAEAKAKADVEKLQFDHALSGALSNAKARNAKAVAALLDMDSLNLKDGNIAGLDEQLKQLKEENGFLFEADEPAPRIVAPTGTAAQVEDDSAIRAIMGLSTRNK